MQRKSQNIMRKVLFSVVASVIAVALTSCIGHSKFKECTLSIVESSEDNVTAQCIYTPHEKDGGYMVFLVFGFYDDHRMGQKAIDLYKENGGALHESALFSFGDLIPGQEYELIALSYKESDGKVSARLIGSQSFTSPSTSDNHSLVSVHGKSHITRGYGVEFTITKASHNYDVGEFFVSNWDDNTYSASVKYQVRRNEHEAGNDSIYENNPFVYSIYWKDVTPSASATFSKRIFTFNSCESDNSREYVVEITIYCRPHYLIRTTVPKPLT